jgi:hypothetical protein
MNAARLRQPAFLVALAVLAVGAVGMGSAIRMARIYLDKLPIYPRPIDGQPHEYPEGSPTLLSLPTETRNWKAFGADRVETEEVEEVLGTTNYLNRIYVEKNPREGKPPRAIDFHAAYYTDQIDTVPHVPDRCFVGGGMQIGSAAQFLPLNLDRSTWQTAADVPEQWKGRIFTARMSSDFGNGRGRRVRLPRDPEAIEMKTMEFIHPGSDRRIYAGYFFIANGGTVARAEGVRLLAFNLTDDYAYYLKIQFTSDRVESAEDLRDAATDLLNDLLPEIMLCIPDWIEVETGLWPPDNPRARAAASAPVPPNTPPPTAPQAAPGDRR